MNSPFRLEPLDEAHERTGFACGQERLDRYVQTQVTQDMRRRLATCFVAVDSDSGQVAAYYTLSAAGIPIMELPAEIVKKLPRYPSIPAVRIRRLAVDSRFQGCGLGGALLADALCRVMTAPPVVYALLVDAKNENAVAFYRHHGFVALLGQPRMLFLLVASAEKTLL